MNDRLQRLEEMMKSFHAFKKPTAFKGDSAKMPRITSSQWTVLRSIGQRGTCTVKDISEDLSMTSSAVTQLVDGLVHSRYVVRKVNENDRRKVALTLSAKSTQNIERMKKHMLEHMLNAFSVLNDTEFEQLFKLNKKVADSLFTIQ